MDYKVLYRKYRPDDFAGVIGQDYMTSILKNAINTNKISHAYIFSGPRGTGKTSTAKIFAKAINCLSPSEYGPCNKCESCKTFKENADIIEIDAASNNGVDEIREIINNIKLAPAYSKYKVYIIDEVHMLSTSAFNALLLTLEEPPKHVVFILATTNIDDEALEEIAYISDGGMRDALSILDQLSSNNNEITLNDVISHFGSVSKKQINDLYEYIIKNNVDKFDEMMKNFKKLAIDYKLLIKKLLEKIEEEAIKSKKDCNYTGLDYSLLKEMAFELAKISNYININIDPYLLIEITLLKYFPNKNNTIEKKENKPTEIISREIISEENNSKIEEQTNKLIAIRVNNCFVNAKKEYLQTIKDSWINFVNKIDSKILLNLLIDSKIAAASDKVIILTHAINGTVNLINENLDSIAKEYKNILSIDYKFIALTESKWLEEKNTYITNLKNKVIYKYIEEKVDEIAPVVNDNNLEKTALDIFDKDKIEIE